MYRKIRKGTTLIEIMVAIGVFSILIVVLFLIMKYCIRNWRTVEDRVAVQTSIQQIEANLEDVISKTSFRSILIYNSDYRHAISCATFVDPTTGKFDVDEETSMPISHGCILFVLLRPCDDPCLPAGSDPKVELDPSRVSNPDNVCPHKLILRVDLTRNDDSDLTGSTPANTWDPIILDSSTLPSYIPQISHIDKIRRRGITKSDYIASITGDPKYVRSVKVIAKDILSFNVEKQSNPPGVEVILRGFRHLEAGEYIHVGTQDITGSRFAVEVKNLIIPQNP